MRVLLSSLLLALLCQGVAASEPRLDLTRAVVLTPVALAGPEEKAAQMLIEEVEKRTGLRWQRVQAWPSGKNPVIVVGPGAGVQQLAGRAGVTLPDGLGRGGREGYRIGTTTGANMPVVWVAGNDPRGTLFGVGRLLRSLRLERRRVSLAGDFAVESAPETPLRGQQLGYRPKTNSYDGWTIPMWEQYLRDLIVFGGNAIELIPPRSDDAADSPHFPLPPLRMMIEMSRLADAYGLDVWIWYPALDRDYADPKTVDAALAEWGAIFKALPRIDAIFVPGGDPGQTAPGVLLPFLEKQTANLRQYHPRAQMWVSAQGFNQVRLDEFLTLLRQEPAWLAGIVHGPQTRLPLADFRKVIPARYPVRDYPDVTHNRHCQYPVTNWDLALAVTEGREACNPRPLEMAHIYRLSRPHTAGFITYSEGCHDDVNEVVWRVLGWDSKADVREALREYARYFISPAFEERFADGLLGLERNWQGPVRKNAGIDATLQAFRAMEREASPAVKLNWRFQQALYRAYFDAYVRARQIYEAQLEEEAMQRLRDGRKLGALRAMDEAEAVLAKASREPVAAELRARVFELAEALFQSIRAQLSVVRYQAIAVDRGANLDTIDFPLNDAGWLRHRFTAIRALPTEAERLAGISAMLTRTDPGPGGFYDDLGDPERQPHLVVGQGAREDPGYYASALVGYGFRGPGPDTKLPRAWWQHAETMYDTPLTMRYTGLDPTAAYRVRVVFGQDRKPAKVRLVASGRFEIHDYLSRAYEPLEFDIPAAATASGELTLTWTQPPGGGGHGRGGAVAEVWLLKQTP